MGIPGIAIRVVILVAWVGLSGTHLAHHLLPGLGLVPQADSASTMASRLDRTYRYRLNWRPSPAAEWAKVGTCAVGWAGDDVGARTFTEIDVTDTRMIPGVKLIRQAIGATARGLRIRIEQLLDSSLRLRSVEVSGQVFGIRIDASGPVDHRGLTLNWKAGGHEGVQVVPEVRPERVSGSELAMGLPPGLKSGARFSTTISTIDPTRMRLATKTAVFSVVGLAPGGTAGGTADLREVEMRVEDRLTARLWCDEAGVVHRQEIADQGLQLSLEGIYDVLGQKQWPVEAR